MFFLILSSHHRPIFLPSFPQFEVTFMGESWEDHGRKKEDRWEALRREKEEKYAKSLEVRKIFITFVA